VTRLVWMFVALLLVASSCSAGGDATLASDAGASSEAGGAAADPVATFCQRWDEFAEFTEDDVEPSEELAKELRDLTAEVQQVVPDAVAADWQVIVDFNGALLNILQRVGWGPVTDEVFVAAFGDAEAAEAASERAGAAYQAIYRWQDTNCRLSNSDQSAVALPVQFCTAWGEFTALTADDAEFDEIQWEQLKDILDRANANVPAAVADDWMALADFVDRYGDVLVTVEFDQERITDDMLVQAFGSVASYDEAVAAREAATAAIAEWSLEGCGEFCARWPDMARVQADLEWLHWVIESPENGPARLEEHLRTLAIFDQLAPDEIRDTWTAIDETYQRWVDAWERADFEPERTESVLQDEALEWARTAPDLAKGIDFGPETAFFVRVLEEWQAGATEVPVWVYERWSPDFQPDQLDEIREELEANDPFFWELIVLFERDELPSWIREHVVNPPGYLTAGLMSEVEAWVDANCDEVTGRPGTLKVFWPRVEGYAGGMVVMALVPLGGSYEDLADVPGTVAATCEGVRRDPWGVWLEDHQDENGERIVEEGRFESEFFRDERWSEDHICGFNHEAAPPQIDSGRYTLVGGIMWGEPGDPTEGFDLVSCVAVDVMIDSDTVVDLPPFEPCDVRVGAGGPDPWRHPSPVDPSTPGAGTLKVLVPELVTPPGTGSRHGGELMVVALPAGATLNEVGRRQLWPAAVVATSLPAAGSEHARELARQGSALLPLGALPPTGRPTHLDAGWLAEDPPEDKLPLALLPPGLYDLRFELRWHVDESDEVPPAATVRWDEASLCAQSEVIIDGDVVVDLPELGECP